MVEDVIQQVMLMEEVHHRVILLQVELILQRH
jgi:hypothetical protein